MERLIPALLLGDLPRLEYVPDSLTCGPFTAMDVCVYVSAGSVDRNSNYVTRDPA